MEWTGHKQHTSGITVSHHPQMGPSSCRKTSSGLPVILHDGELYNYFIIYYNVIIIEIRCTINEMCLNHPETIPASPGPWKNCLPRNPSLVLKTLGTTVLQDLVQRNAYLRKTIWIPSLSKARNLVKTVTHHV